MKKISSFFIAFAALILLSQCNIEAPQNLSDNTSREKIINELINNDSYREEVMYSMQTKHHDAMLSNVLMTAKNNEQIQSDMMDQMMEMGKADSSMFKMMMGKSMAMCNNDPAMCKMMMGAMHENPNVMKNMRDMHGMKMTPGK
ncbi:hypothetical protein [Haliscomenobacter sp.]|uniref:hypothetical protein n=1 Tax=Haliscomenobacter sp. TaxID=2717303 RepID=UPI0035932B47